MTEGELMREVWGEEQYGPVECRHEAACRLVVHKGRPANVVAVCQRPGCGLSWCFDYDAVMGHAGQRMAYDVLRIAPRWARAALSNWVVSTYVDAASI